jgi:hypothetical protein
LVWTRDADAAGGPRTWQEALEYPKSLNRGNHLGRNDWRLPNVNELESLLNRQSDPALWLPTQGFLNVRADCYWTSSTYASHAPYAWGVDINGGILAGHDKADRCHVWPMRQGEPGAVALPRSGQSACHDSSGTTVTCAGTGQDGEAQAGVAWPSPRFAVNADQTITDRLTGLVWSRDGLAPGPDVCRPGTSKTLQGALDFVRCLDVNGYLGKKDWRLPNCNELATLVNRGEADSAAWLNAQGFSSVQSSSYWSSSTFVSAAWNGWSVNLHDGAVTTFAKTHDINVWPVRDGE